MAALRDLLEVRIKALENYAQDNRDLIEAIPFRINERALAEKALGDERFKSIEAQFRQRDQAIDKSDLTTTKQLDLLSSNTRTLIAGSESKIDAVRDRLYLLESQVGRIESRGVGSQETRQSQATNTNLIFTIIMAAVAVIAILLPFMMRPSAPTLLQAAPAGVLAVPAP